MVALGAGRLAQKNLLSINHLKELRFIEVTPEALTIGSGTTFTDIRKHPVIHSDFVLLELAAGWTGSIANQNRGTLGGNIVNGSPAADSPPALLAYDAELTLISSRGTRIMPYADFHLGYKKTALAPDELLHSITMKRVFSDHIPYTRKIGTRNAQAISKVNAVAALARMRDGRIDDIRIGSCQPSRPAHPADRDRTRAQESSDHQGHHRSGAGSSLHFAETCSIDDIRSTAKYRRRRCRQPAGRVPADVVGRRRAKGRSHPISA